MATVGNTSIEANDATVPTNQMTGFRFQASGSFTAQSMYLYVLSTWTAGRKAVFGIYSDVATLPDTLLGQTAETTSTGVDEWHGVDLQSGVSIVSGSWYWLVAHANANLLYRRVGGTGKMANENVGSYSTTMPATFTESLVITQNGSIYASSEVVAAANLIDVELSNAGLYGVTVGDAGLHGATVSDSGLHGVTLSDSSRSS